MELEHPQTQFGLPNSPPPTPNSARRRIRTSPNSNYYAVLAANRNKRHGFAAFGLSPPEHISPREEPHQFSYTRQEREEDSESESDAADDENEEDEDDDSDASDESDNSAEDKASVRSKGKRPAFSSDQDSDLIDRRPSVIRSHDDADFTLEDISEDDIAYDELPVIRPDFIEEARSVAGSKGSERDIVDRLKDLSCGREEELERARLFDAEQRARYKRRSKRWSVGGYKKRSHTQSVGSQSSGHEDLELQDELQSLGGTSRRLRRRTQGPEDHERPNRTSLMFDDPPRELEELAVEDPPPLLDSDGDLWDDDDDSDGIEEIDLILPQWLMALDSNPPSRPSTAVSVASIVLAPSTPV